MKLQLSAKTDIGLKRKVNEDCVYVNEEIGLCAVADGMGGHSAGDVASRMVIDIIEESFSDFEPTDDESIKEAINETIQLANYAVKTSASQNPEQRGMGSTLTLLYFFIDKYYVAQVGDSRAYMIRDNQIFQITEDHSLVQQELERGLITEKEAESHVFKNIITRAIGIKDEVEVDFFSDRVMDDDYLLICSDGLTNKVSNLDILKEITTNRSLDNITSALIELANLKDGSDNISLVLVKVGEKTKEMVSQARKPFNYKYLFYPTAVVILAIIVFFAYRWVTTKKIVTSLLANAQPTVAKNVKVSTPFYSNEGVFTPTEAKETLKPTIKGNIAKSVGSEKNKTKIASSVSKNKSHKLQPTISQALKSIASHTREIVPTATMTSVPKVRTPKPTIKQPAKSVSTQSNPFVSPRVTPFSEQPKSKHAFGIEMNKVYYKGLDTLNEQDLEKATLIWNNWLLEFKKMFTIQIEVDSQTESVLNTFNLYRDLNLFMIRRGKRYYVYGGLFKNKTEAMQAIQTLPKEIKKVHPMVRQVVRIVK